jgi:hypothetical protein
MFDIVLSHEYTPKNRHREQGYQYPTQHTTNQCLNTQQNSSTTQIGTHNIELKKKKKKNAVKGILSEYTGFYINTHNIIAVS